MAHQSSKNYTGIFGVIILAVAVFGLIKIFSAPSQNSDQNQSVKTEVSQNDWILGNKDAKVTLLEYSDFQCPACALYYPWVKKINEDYKDQIRFVYRNFPLKEIHQNAQLAAQAAEAAGNQGKFWEMHDLLLEKQNEWSKTKDAMSDFEKYASSLNLNLEKFKADINSKEIKDKVESDYFSGLKLGVDGTPTFFLNDKKIENPQNYDQYKTIIQQAIKDNP